MVPVYIEHPEEEEEMIRPVKPLTERVRIRILRLLPALEVGLRENVKEHPLIGNVVRPALPEQLSLPEEPSHQVEEQHLHQPPPPHQHQLRVEQQENCATAPDPTAAAILT